MTTLLRAGLLLMAGGRMGAGTLDGVRAAELLRRRPRPSTSRRPSAST